MSPAEETCAGLAAPDPHVRRVQGARWQPLALDTSTFAMSILPTNSVSREHRPPPAPDP